MKLRDATCTRKCPARKKLHPTYCDYLVECEFVAAHMLTERTEKRNGKPDRRKHPCRLQTRVDMDTDYAFRTLCHERGKTVSDMLLELVKNAVAQAEGGGVRDEQQKEIHGHHHPGAG